MKFQVGRSSRSSDASVHSFNPERSFSVPTEWIVISHSSLNSSHSAPCCSLYFGWIQEAKTRLNESLSSNGNCSWCFLLLFLGVWTYLLLAAGPKGGALSAFCFDRSVVCYRVMVYWRVRDISVILGWTEVIFNVCFLPPFCGASCMQSS